MNNKFTHDIIVFTETWVKHATVQLCHIPGYTAYHSFRHSRDRGGVSIFIKSSIISEPIDLDINSDDIECVGAKIKCYNNDDWIKLIGVYRPPNKSPYNFTCNMENLILDLNLNTSNAVFVGDFNICILDESLPETRALLELFRSYYFRPVVLCPTRVTKTSSSVIDHVWCNLPHPTQSTVVTVDITDHFPVSTVIKNINCKPNKLIHFKFRNYSVENTEKFRDKLRNIDWDLRLAECNDVDGAVALFLNTLTHYIMNVFLF